MMKKRDKRGFTLTELAVVLAVISILAAILIPSLSAASRHSSEAAFLAEAKDRYALYLKDHAGDERFYLPSAVKVGDSYFTVSEGEVHPAKHFDPATVSAADCAEHEGCESILFDTALAERIITERGSARALAVYAQFKSEHTGSGIPVTHYVLVGSRYFPISRNAEIQAALTEAEAAALHLTPFDCSDGTHAACAFIFLEGTPDEE